MLTVFDIETNVDLVQYNPKVIGLSVCDHDKFERCRSFVVV